MMFYNDLLFCKTLTRNERRVAVNFIDFSPAGYFSMFLTFSFHTKAVVDVFVVASKCIRIIFIKYNTFVVSDTRFLALFDVRNVSR